MTIDMRSVAWVSGVVVQGLGSSGGPYATEIEVEYSLDNITYSAVPGSFVTSLSPSSGYGYGYNTEDVIPFPPVSARYVKIIILAFSGHPCMRAGILVASVGGRRNV